MNRRALLIGVVGLVGCTAGLILAPRETLAAWLVAWLGWGSIPIGALAVLMLVALIPGTWRTLYARPLVIGATLMPLVLVAVVPLLVGLDALYPWTSPAVAEGFSGFKALWLSSGFFIVRTLVYLLVLSAFAFAIIAASPRVRPAIAAVGVILYAIIGSLIGVDFAESTEPQFHSSIYGLLALTNQWLAGISFAIIVGLWEERGKAPFAAAGVLVTALLLWGYMHAMQYVVIWAGDIPEEARWYLERGAGQWWALAWLLFGLQGLLTFGALLSPDVRSSRRAMIGLAALTLVMRVAENAWLILPGLPGIGWATVPLMIAASLAMLGFGWAGAELLRHRHGDWMESGWAPELRST